MGGAKNYGYTHCTQYHRYSSTRYSVYSTIVQFTRDKLCHSKMPRLQKSDSRKEKASDGSTAAGAPSVTWIPQVSVRQSCSV